MRNSTKMLEIDQKYRSGQEHYLPNSNVYTPNRDLPPSSSSSDTDESDSNLKEKILATPIENVLENSSLKS